MEARDEVMLFRSAPVAALAALVVVSIAQFLRYLPRLPERIAVHFGMGGGANGWSDTGTFALVYGLVEAAIVVSALAIGRLLEHAPPGSINIPNREYWLADERRRATLSVIARHFMWLECLTLAFLVSIAQIIFRANLRGSPPTLPNDFWLTITAFVAAVAWVAVRIHRRFGAPEPRE